jgi:hypothetical protein
MLTCAAGAETGDLESWTGDSARNCLVQVVGHGPAVVLESSVLTPDMQNYLDQGAGSEYVVADSLLKAYIAGAALGPYIRPAAWSEETSLAVVPLAYRETAGPSVAVHTVRGVAEHQTVVAVAGEATIAMPALVVLSYAFEPSGPSFPPSIVAILMGPCDYSLCFVQIEHLRPKIVSSYQVQE